jgi:RimJ/RimL family protein N-acetyltransferase
MTASPITIRQLGPEDAAAYQQLRLEGLRESPTAFGSSYTDEGRRTLAEVADIFKTSANALSAVFGAMADGQLVAVVGLACTSAEKRAHNATVWGMYVAPTFRRRGAGQALLHAIIAYARTIPHLRNLKLGVNAANTAAIALYQSHGFTRYGLDRESLLVENIFHDEELYVLSIKQ